MFSFDDEEEREVDLLVVGLLLAFWRCYLFREIFRKSMSLFLSSFSLLFLFFFEKEKEKEENEDEVEDSCLLLNQSLESFELLEYDENML